VLGESAGEVHHKDIDIGAAARDLGWAPRHSLPQRLAETAAWYRENEPLWRAAATG
jgi:nucleoside-diphosphate-sugar epimerase